jgi:DNA-binding PadR family transcriptional regulator
MRSEWFSGRAWMGWPGFPFGQRGSRFFESGEVRLAILSLLAETPRNGYQLIKELQERSGGVYRASAGSVYPTLQQLEDEGLIELKPRDGKRIYELTAAGRAELERDPEAVHRIWKRAERWEDWGQNMRPESFAVLGPAVAVMKASMQAIRSAGGDREREQKILDILSRACRELEELTATGPATGEREAPEDEKRRSRKKEDDRASWFL